MLILSLFCITLGCLLASGRVRCTHFRRNSCSDPWNIRVHADVPEVSQRYILDASKLRDTPRDSLSATEFACVEWLA